MQSLTWEYNVGHTEAKEIRRLQRNTTEYVYLVLKRNTC